MNYLGHWFFSEPSPDALIGSLWPDFARRPVPESVSHTFLVHFDRHQWLDKETDQTPLLETLRAALRPRLRKTTPIVLDMLIDHHLARHWSRFHHQPLTEFTGERYRLAKRFTELPLPARLQRTLAWMSQDDWLAGYRHPENLLRALAGLSRRLRFKDPMVEQGRWALEIYREHESGIDAYLDELIERCQ